MNRITLYNALLCFHARLLITWLRILSFSVIAFSLPSFAFVGKDLLSMKPKYVQYDIDKDTHFFTDKELTENEYYFKNGLMYSMITNELAYFFGKQMLIVSENGRIFIFGKRMLRRIHHSSASRGKNVFFAGEIQSRFGKIEMINNGSGHYKPDTNYIYNVLNYFRNLGADLKDTEVVFNDPNHRYKFKTYGSSSEFLKDARHVGTYHFNQCLNFYNK